MAAVTARLFRPPKSSVQIGRMFTVKKLELRFQNHQLARTLLDLNMKMQQLKKRQDQELASKPQSPQDKEMNSECGSA